MNSRSLWLATALSLAAFAAIGDDSPTGATPLRTEGGAVRGVVESGIAVYRGIPYAVPPVGGLRWRPPQRVHSWPGVRDASRLSPDCMQAPFGLPPPGGRHPVAEDCLYLNVWRPASEARRLPVMVWIHGGGFVNGGSSSPDSTGAGVASRGIVFVSFNYRLGRFGFFAFPALNAERRDEATANYALMDQMAALQWIRRNIDDFGGDPHNVTVVGESAGGMSINMLLSSPAAKGLFDRVIVQSGGGRGLMRPRYLTEDTALAPSATTLGIRFAKSKGIEGSDADALQQLRALSAEQITSGLNMVSLLVPDHALFAGPVIDGTLFPETPEQAFVAGRQHPVPMIVGATSADLGFGTARSVEEAVGIFGPDADTALRLYDADGARDLKRLNAVIAADRAMVEPARFIARSMLRLNQPVYAYRFDYVPEAKRASSPWGAQHATDVPFAFDLLPDVYGDAVTTEDARVAALMCDYWVAFASTGNPNGTDRTAWPRYESITDVILEFTRDGRATASADPWRTRLDLVEGLSRVVQ